MLVQSPVIDHKVPLTHNEAMTLPSADLWRQAEEAEIKSLNGNNVLLPTRLPAGQKLMHKSFAKLFGRLYHFLEHFSKYEIF